MTRGTVLVFLLCVVFIGLYLLSSDYAEWVAVGLMVLAGIPHGSFDLRVAEEKWSQGVVTRRLIFTLYVVSVVGMSSLCVLLPALGLSLFLIISVLHFSEGELLSQGWLGRLRAWIFGVGAILLPIGLHSELSETYLAYFVSPTLFQALTPSLVLIARCCAVIMASLISLDLFRGEKDVRQEAMQRAICLLSWCILPPLSGFSVWFIGRHSRQHLELCRDMFHSSPRGIPLDFALISVLAVVGLAPFVLLFDFSDLSQLFSAFICLIAGLTLPHIVVSHGMRRRQSLDPLSAR